MLDVIELHVSRGNHVCSHRDRAGIRCPVISNTALHTSFPIYPLIRHVADAMVKLELRLTVYVQAQDNSNNNS